MLTLELGGRMRMKHNLGLSEYLNASTLTFNPKED